MSNFFGQMVVEKMGHVVSLSASLFISFIPILIFGLFMPETRNTRGTSENSNSNNNLKVSCGDEKFPETDYVLT